MTITLELPTDIATYLRRHAAQAGQDEQAVALRLLTDLVRSVPPDEPDAMRDSPPAARSMADLFAGRAGVVAGSGEAYSEDGGGPLRRPSRPQSPDAQDDGRRR